MDCRPPGSSVHEISQARILEWVAISFSRGSSRPRDQAQDSCTTGRFFIDWATREAPFNTLVTLVTLVNIRLCNPDIHMNSLGTKDLQMSHDAKKGQNMGQNLGESSLYIVCRTTFWHAGHVGPASTRAINICKSYFLQMIESVEILEVEWLIHPFIP